MVKEELLTLSKPETPTSPTSDTPPEEPELTPEEEKKFTKFLGKWLEEDDAPTGPANPSSVSVAPSATASPALDIKAAINSALDEREKSQKTNSTLESLAKEVEALKASSGKRKARWYEPWSWL